MQLHYVQTTLTTSWVELPTVGDGAKYFQLSFADDASGLVGFFFDIPPLPTVPPSGEFLRSDHWFAKFAQVPTYINGQPSSDATIDLPDGTLIVNPEGFGTKMTIPNHDSEGNESGTVDVYKVVYLYAAKGVPALPGASS